MVGYFQVVAGGVHSLILLEDGTVYSCGINEKGTVPADGVEPEGSTDRLTPINFSDEIRRHGKVKFSSLGVLCRLLIKYAKMYPQFP